MRIIIIFIIYAFFPLAITAQWMPDMLGDGYEMRYVDHPDDYNGPVRSTVIRKTSSCNSDKAILYVHGYNDYFFQNEMGDRFVDSCINFYAVDLRRYGRSITDMDTRFQVRDIREYFADIDSAFSVMRSDGIHEAVLMGHSTGGLIVSLYMDRQPDPMVSAIILNSPFLEWNMNGFMRKVAVPIVGCVGTLFPKLSLSQGQSTAYAESLLKNHHGEWTYNTDWKTFYPLKVQASWIRAIDNAHAELQNGARISVPILLMHSDNSVKGSEWAPDFQHGDAVLNVDDISKYGCRLGLEVTELTINGGLHDLVLSEMPVRNSVYKKMLEWLSRKGLIGQ